MEDPRAMPGWVGATRTDALAYCWLSDEMRFLRDRTNAIREAHNRVDAEEVARRVHRLIRFEQVADIPPPERLVAAAEEQLSRAYPRFWKKRNARLSAHAIGAMPLTR